MSRSTRHPRHLRSRERRTLIGFVTSSAVVLTVSGVALTAGTGPADATVAYTQTENVSDGMLRTVVGGFGTADLGGSYTTAPASRFSVSSGAGHITGVPSGASATATLAALAADEQLQSTFSLPSIPTRGAGVAYSVELRHQAGGDAYRAQLGVANKGRLALSLLRVRNGVATTLAGGVTLPFSAGAGSAIVLDGLVSGSAPVTLQARAWRAGTTVPTWQLTGSDATSSAITSGGKVGLSASVAPNTKSSSFDVLGVRGWSLSGGQTSTPSPTASPSATPTSTVSPTPSPTTSAQPVTGATPSPTTSTSGTAYPVPGSIPADCSSDVTSALASFVNGVPDSSTITFTAGGCYLVQGTLEFRARNGLTFDGNGATIKATSVSDDTRSHWRFLYGSNLTFRNMTIVGANAGGGTSTAWTPSLQHQMGIDLRGVKGAEISGMTISNVYGDCLYVGVGYDNTTWTSAVYAHDNTCTGTGRSGISVTAGRDITLDHNAILKPGLWGVDIEPNGGATGAVNVSVTNSTFTPGGHLEPFVQAVGASGGGVVDTITITGNTVKGMTLTTQFLPAAGQRWKNITFSNNTSDKAGYLIYNNACGCVVVVNVTNIDGMTVEGNYQPGPGSDETFLYTTGSCTVRQSGNQFPGGGTLAVVAPYACA